MASWADTEENDFSGRSRSSGGNSNSSISSFCNSSSSSFMSSDESEDFSSSEFIQDCMSRTGQGRDAFSHLFPEQSLVLRASRNHLQDVILSMDQEYKQEYLDAVAAVPARVQQESDPDRFLVFDFYNAWPAAARLAAYWKERKRIFGDRWLLKLGGNDLYRNMGAVALEDIAVIQTGVVNTLPNTCQGLPVIYIDTSKLANTNFSETAKERALFFTLQKISERENAPNGFVALVYLDKTVLDGASLPSSSSQYESTLKQAFNLLEHAMPCKLSFLYLLVSVKKAEKKKFLKMFTAPGVLESLGCDSSVVIKIYTDEHKRNMFRKLKMNGDFARENLPQDLGGTLILD